MTRDPRRCHCGLPAEPCEGWLDGSGCYGLAPEWRTVAEAPAYEVSNDGRVRNARTRRVLRPTRCSSPARPESTYLKVGLREGCERRLWRYVHRLVATAFLGAPPEGADCLHGPGGSEDNRVENLRWGTRSENLHEAHCPERRAIQAEARGELADVPVEGCPF